MKLKNTMILINLIIIFIISFIYSVFAENELVGDDQHRGIINLRNEFSIFPEGRLGNAVYRNSIWLMSRSDLMVIDIMSAYGGYIFYGQNEQKHSIVDYQGSTDVKFQSLGSGFYQLTKNNLSKIYRITTKKQIQDVLSGSRTANGLVINKRKDAVFYHIKQSKPVTDAEGNITGYEFSLQLHLVKAKSPKSTLLGGVITNTRPSLKLAWINDTTLQYELEDGIKQQRKIE